MPSAKSRNISAFSQAFPPAPEFTERNVGDLVNKVIIVTGATSGVGFDLARLLYDRGATVYLGGRSAEKIELAIKQITEAVNTSKGRLIPTVMDLSDFSTVKAAVDDFVRRETRLDVLVHNAGVMTPPSGSKNGLGYDLEMATNCMGPFLLTCLLEPLLVKTAGPEKPADVTLTSTRIVWVSSWLAAGTPKGGIEWDADRNAPKVIKNAMMNYMQSKVGNVFLASEAARHLKEKGIISLSVNPGLMRTQLQRNSPKVMRLIMSVVFKPAVYGAYTELFAATSPTVKAEHNGGFIVPWGRFGQVPSQVEEGLKSKEEGGTGLAQKFWTWCEEELEQFSGSNL